MIKVDNMIIQTYLCLLSYEIVAPLITCSGATLHAENLEEDSIFSHIATSNNSAIRNTRKTKNESVLPSNQRKDL